MRIAMTSIHVTDPDEALTIYTERFGFLVHTHMPDMRLAIVVSPEDPDGTALLLEPDDHPVARAYRTGIYEAGLPAIVLGCEDLDATWKDLTARGVRGVSPPADTPWGRQAIVDDGVGNLIQLHQAPPS